MVSHQSIGLRACGFLCALLLNGAAQAQLLPWTEQDVTLVTPTGTLYGTELIPKSAIKVPVVLIHAGSGPTDRNGNSRLLPGPNDSLRQLAEGLARLGVASLRYDKRGVGKSAVAMTSESTIRFSDYVSDAAAWIGQLRADRRFSRVVVAGHSEGSLIGMLAAGKAGAGKAGADAFVSIAGVARSADEILRIQLAPKLTPALAAENEAILTSLKAGKTVAEVSAPLAALYRPSVQPYLISWFAWEPRKVLATLTVPVLILQGTSDFQVTVLEARELAAARPDAKLVIIDGMNHLLKIVGQDPDLQQRSYSAPDLPVSPRLIEEIAIFSKQKAQ